MTLSVLEKGRIENPIPTLSRVWWLMSVEKMTELELDDLYHEEIKQDKRVKSKVEPESEERSEDSYAMPIKVRRARRLETILDLLNAIISAGIVSVPKTFHVGGIGPTVGIMMIACFFCFLGGCTLIDLQLKFRVVSIDQLAAQVFGPIGRVISVIMCAVYNLSLSSSHLIIGAHKISKWLSIAGLEINSSVKWAVLVLIYSLVITFPLTIPRDMAFAKSFSYMTTACVIFYSIAMMYECSRQLSYPGSISPTAKGFGFSWNMLIAFGIHVSAFALPILQMPIIRNYNPRPHKRKSLTAHVYLITFVLTCLPGALAYLLKGEDTRSDVLSSFSTDGTFLILQILMLISVTLSYPLIANTALGGVSLLFFNEARPEKLSRFRRNMLFIMFNIVNLVLACLRSDIGPILGFGGALGGCFMVFFFSSLCRIISSWREISWMKRIFHILMILFGITVTAGSTYYSAIEVFRAKHDFNY